MLRYLCVRITCFSLFAVMMLAAYATPVSAAVQVVHQEVIRDHELPMKYWHEGWSNPQQFYPDLYTPGALVRAYVQSDEPLEVESLWLDGVRVTTLHDHYAVQWYRVVPLREDPSLTKIEVRVRDAKPEDQPYVLSVQQADESVTELSIENRNQPFALGYLTINAQGDRLLGHLVRSTDEVMDTQQVWLNGQDVSDKFEIVGDGWYGDVAAFEIKLTEPLEEGEFCVLRVGEGDGAAAGDIRVFYRPFSVGMYGGPNAELEALGFNTVLRYHPQITKEYLDSHEEHGLMLIGRVMIERNRGEEAQEQVSTHPAIYAIYGFDEPDLKDYRLTEVPLGFRVGRTGMVVDKEQKEYRQLQPGLLYYMVVNHTFKPANWFAYGPLSDINAIDPYPFMRTQTFQGGDNMKEAIAEVANIMRMGARPRPYHTTLGLFHFEPGRMPTEEELRSQVYWALAEGTKGINYFSWSFRSGKGFEDYPELHPFVKELNELCNELGDDLNVMHPADTVLAESENVQGGVLHHPDGSLLVFLIHDDADDVLDQAQISIVAPSGGADDLKWELVDGSGELAGNVVDGQLTLTVTADRSSAIVRVGR